MLRKNLSPLIHSLLLTGTIALVYLWLQIPFLAQYSLQAFFATMAAFLIIKRTKNAKFWHILPEKTSVEMVLLTFGFMLLIGSTGNMDSFFYPVTYIHLFFLVLSSHTSTSIIVAVLVVLFHFALAPTLSPREISQLMNLPIMLLFFLFAKEQYDEVFLERELLEQERAKERQLEDYERQLLAFISQSQLPKIKMIREKLAQTDQETQNQTPVAEALATTQSLEEDTTAVIAQTEYEPPQNT